MMNISDGNLVTLSLEIEAGIIFKADLAQLYYMNKYSGGNDWLTVTIPEFISPYNGTRTPEVTYRMRVEVVYK